MDIAGKTIVVTGASSGIGAATARAMAERGAAVALVARTRRALETVAAEIHSLGGQARFYPADLSDPAAVEGMARSVTNALGTPDIIVNSAGAGRWLFTEETPPDEAAQMMGAPYFAAFFTTRAFLPQMLERGAGHIVNVNSPAARIVWPGATGYTAARWAMQGFTNALRADVCGTGLRVTSIVCGEVHTPYFTTHPGTLERAPKLARRLIPALEPEQVAAAILRAVEHNQREVVMPLMLRLFYVLQTIAPRFVETLTLWSGWRHPRAARSQG